MVIATVLVLDVSMFEFKHTIDAADVAETGLGNVVYENETEPEDDDAVVDTPILVKKHQKN